LLETVLVKVGCRDATSRSDGLDELRGLAAPAGAGVERAMPLTRIEQQRDELRALLLHGEVAVGIPWEGAGVACATHAKTNRGKLGRGDSGVRVRGSNLVGNRLAVATTTHAEIDRRKLVADVEKRLGPLVPNRRHEPSSQPLGDDDLRWWLWVLRPLRRNLSQDRVRESRHAFPALVAHELDRVVNDRVRRYTPEMKELKHRCAEHSAHPVVDLHRSRRVTLHCCIEIRNDAKRAVYDLSRECGIDPTRARSLELGIERAGCPGAVVRHPMEHVRCDSSRLGNHAPNLTRTRKRGTEIGDDSGRVIP
jgi:hypothetical protein